MLDDLSQAGTDGGEKVIEIQVRNHRVVHFQQKPYAVPFVRQLSLGRLGLLKIKRVIDGQRHLSGNLLEEPKLRGPIGFLSNTAYGHDSQSSVRGAQRQTVTGSQGIVSQPLHRARKANFVIDIVNK